MSSTGARSYRPRMVASATQTSWQQGQDALREEVRRVTTLLRSIDDPLPGAVGQWNLGEVAMHLSQVWAGLATLASVAGDSLVQSIGELGEATVRSVNSDPERDL